MMEMDNSIIADLMSLGLRKNEARAYYALVANGQATASNIASLARVPRSKVYDALYGLEGKGLIRRVASLSPTEFRAYSPRETIPFLVERVENLGKSVMNALIKLEQEKTDDEGNVRTVVGKQQIIMELRTTIGRAQRTVKISARETGVLKSLKPTFAQARHRGVRIELYITAPLKEDLHDLQHYLTIRNLSPSSEKLEMSVREVLVEPAIVEGISSPEETSIFIIDGTESVAIFNYGSKESRPWALCVRNTLIATIQWQVIKTILSVIGYEPRKTQSKRAKRRFRLFYGK